jgi:hypothetical protein
MLKSPDEMRAELYETGTMDQLERLHIQVQIEALESQKLAAAAIVKNSRYMLMSVVMATIATTITAAGLVFNIISLARVLRWAHPFQSLTDDGGQQLPQPIWAKRRSVLRSTRRIAISFCRIAAWWLSQFWGATVEQWHYLVQLKLCAGAYSVLKPIDLVRRISRAANDLDRRPYVLCWGQRTPSRGPLAEQLPETYSGRPQVEEPDPPADEIGTLMSAGLRPRFNANWCG